MLRRHALSDAVATILPGPSETQLLKGCLDRSDVGKRALDAWLSQQFDAIASLTKAPMKWLLPLVFRACSHHRLNPGSALVTVLKTAALHEELRTRSYRAIRRSALAALNAAKIDLIVLKGAALCELVYPDPSLRHTHDVELLIHAAGWDRVHRTLAPLGFSGSASIEDAPRAELRHVSGLPLVLHRRLFQIPFFNVPHDDVWMRAELVPLSGATARVLSPADMVVHVCGHALHSASSGSYRWIADAWYLLDRRPDLDWDVLARVASARQMVLPLALSLNYLAHELHARVPAAVCERMTAIAAEDRSVGPEVALHGARKTAGGLIPLMRRTRTMHGRAAIVGHLVSPSIAFLSWATLPRSPWLTSMHAQTFRVARYAVRRTSSAVSRLQPRSKGRLRR